MSRIPDFNQFRGCPKCRIADDETSYRPVSTTYHSDIVDAGGTPCYELKVQYGRAQMVTQLGLMGEHLCRTCTRCGFGWVEKTTLRGSVYDIPAGWTPWTARVEEIIERWTRSPDEPSDGDAEHILNDLRGLVEEGNESAG